MVNGLIILVASVLLFTVLKFAVSALRWAVLLTGMALALLAIMPDLGSSICDGLEKVSLSRHASATAWLCE